MPSNALSLHRKSLSKLSLRLKIAYAGPLLAFATHLPAQINTNTIVPNRYIVVYHNYASHVAATPEMAAQIKAVNADVVVQTDRGVTPLVDAVRSRFGLRTTVTSRKPLA